MIKVNNEIVEIKRFPDGTLNIKGDCSIQNYDKILISWHYENDAEFMAVAFLTRYYQAKGSEIILYLPYVPNARMDRVGSPNDIFTMKYFGELINSLNFKRVFVLDTHSSVSYAVIKNCSYVSSSDIVEDVAKYILTNDCHITLDDIPDEIKELIKMGLYTEAEALVRCIHDKKNLIMFYPDEGAVKRYSKELRIPYAFGMKKRNWGTGEILGLDIFGLEPEEIKGKSILIRDDICSKGGTFYHSAKKLKELGADKIYLFVTHCENSIWDGEFGKYKQNLIETGLIDHIFTTDSIYNADNGNYSDRITVIKTIVDFDNYGNAYHFFEDINRKGE